MKQEKNTTKVNSYCKTICKLTDFFFACIINKRKQDNNLSLNMIQVIDLCY